MESREIIVIGTLEQFQGLIQFEQTRSDTVCRGDKDDRSTVDTPFRLYGPIVREALNRASCLYWLVVNGYYNWFLDAYARGDSHLIVGGLHGELVLCPGVGLDEYDREALKLKSTLSQMIHTAEMWATQLPGNRIRVVFNAAGSDSPGTFWRWVDDFVGEMERQGFVQQTVTRPPWLTKHAREEIQVRVSQVVQAIDKWIPKQRYKDEEAYQSALAEYLVGQGIDAPEQQGRALTDILAAHGIGVEIKVRPDRSDYDRLSGQIIRQLEEFGVVIVLIIRPDKRDLLDEYEARFDERVTFIPKG